MALEQIFAKIWQDAQSEAGNTLADAAARADKILDGARSEAALIKERDIAAARNAAEFAFRKEVILKRLSAQQEILLIKKSQLDKCFQEALDILLELDDGLYRSLIKNMLAKINLKEEAEIIFSSHDKGRISNDYIHKINPRLKLSFSADIRAGFILETKDLIMDYSLVNILASLRQNFEPPTAAILFKEF